MAKKYMQISNIADFKSYGVERYHAFVNGRAERVYCQCGHVDTECHDACPKCGCQSVTTSYDKKHYYVLDQTAFPPKVTDVTEWVGIDVDSDDLVTLQIRKTGHTVSLSQNSNAAQIIQEHPELLKMGNYHLFNETREIIAQYIKEDDNGIASWTFAFLDKLSRDRVAIQSVEFVKRVFGLFYGKNVYSKLSAIVSSHRPISQIVLQLEKAHPFVLQACKDGNNLSTLVDNPTRFNNINEEILAFVSAYAIEGYLSEPLRMLERAELLVDEDDARQCFIKFVKEKYASLDWYLHDVETIINYLNAGNRFINVKEYYLYKNNAAMVGGYSMAELSNALANVYSNPTEAIFNLANLK